MVFSGNFVIRNRLTTVCLFAVLLFPLSLYAESFRTSSLHPYEVSISHTITKPESVFLGINDAVEITWPSDNPFIQGLKIEIKIPKIVASYRDAEVFYLYENVYSAKALNSQEFYDNYDFEGNRIYKDLLPSRLSYSFQIPVEGCRLSDKSPYDQVLPVELHKNSKNLVLRTQLAMKGVPDSFFDAQFEVLITPVLADTGLFALTLVLPQLPAPEQDDAEMQIAPDYPLCYIDDQYIDSRFVSMGNDDDTEPVLLGTGMHHLSIVSEQYRNEVRTFSIEKASTTVMSVELQPVTTDITIQAPEGALIKLDGELTEGHRVIPVEPGEHQVTFSFSDYEITKTVMVVRGKRYTVSLAVDIDIFEQE